MNPDRAPDTCYPLPRDQSSPLPTYPPPPPSYPPPFPAEGAASKTDYGQKPGYYPPVPTDHGYHPSQQAGSNPAHYSPGYGDTATAGGQQSQQGGVATGMPMSGVVVAQPTDVTTANQLGPGKPESTAVNIIAIILFVCGIFFPFVWFFLLCLPFCYGGRTVRSLAIAGAVALLIYTFFFALFMPIYFVRRN